MHFALPSLPFSNHGYRWWRTAFVLSVLFGMFCATPAMIETGMNLFPVALADTWPVELIGAALTILDLILTPILFSVLMLVQLNDLQQRKKISA